jgi:tripartite-type tricarboxylate transporter receptor subunit TctC
MLPELPTLDELGIRDYDAANWYAIAAAAGTPPAIIKRLHTEIVNYLRHPETGKRINSMGAEIDIKTPHEMRKILPVEIAKWTKVAIAAGMPRE